MISINTPLAGTIKQEIINQINILLMDKETLRGIYETLSEEHMMVIKGGSALFETVNNNGICTSVNDSKKCDTINSSKKDCQAINHNVNCSAINHRNSCSAINSDSPKCSVVNSSKSCSASFF